MRIALVVERVDPARGGLEAYTAAWAAWLAGQGAGVTILTRYPFEPAVWPARPPSVRVSALPERSGDDLADAARLEALARATADVVHDLGAGLGGDLFQPLYGLRATTQAATWRALGWRRWRPAWRRQARWRALRRREARQVAGGALVIACSRRIAADFRATYALPEDRVHVVPNAIDSASLTPASDAERRTARGALGLPADGTLFVQVAHDFRLKGVATSIRALGCLRTRGLDARLAVVGRGPDRERYAALARRLGIADHTHLLGPLPEARRALQAADALVHPARYDACSLTALEALAAGVPPALSVEDGAAELLTDGVQGWLIREPTDAGEVAFQMARLFDPGLRGAMARQARVLAEHNERAARFGQLLALAVAARQRRSGG